MTIDAKRLRHRHLILLLPGLTLGALLLVAAVPVAPTMPKGEPARTPVSAEAGGPPTSIADIKALEEQIRKVITKVTPSVVSVSGGSGVVISSDGYVLTVAHVARRAGRNVVVSFPNGRRARAVTLGLDQGVDAGMIKIADKGPWPAAEMGASADLKPGQWCLTLGYPVSFEHGKSPPARIGRVLLNRKTEIITDCTIMGGDSGAPLFNLDGKVVAIGTKCDNSLVYNIHVPIDRFRDAWEPLTKGRDFDSLLPTWALLGVLVGGETRIENIAPGSGAEKAGLKPGDVLLKFGGHELHQNDDLLPLIQPRRRGDKVEVELRRDKETVKLQVILGQNSRRPSP